MKADDFDAIVGIDENVLNASKPEYYELKFEKLFSSVDWNDYRRIQFFSANHFSPSKTINLERSL